MRKKALPARLCWLPNTVFTARVQDHGDGPDQVWLAGLYKRSFDDLLKHKERKVVQVQQTVDTQELSSSSSGYFTFQTHIPRDNQV